MPDKVLRVFIASAPVSPWQSNCYVVGLPDAGQCLVIDPGPGSLDAVSPMLEEESLSVAAILMTHGHFDHVWDLGRFAAKHDAPRLIHHADATMVTDPDSFYDPMAWAQVRAQLAEHGDYTGASVTDLTEEFTVAGLTIRTLHAPGHTAGSTLLLITDDEGRELCFTGDVLFRGAIGRTDLRGGDHAAMVDTLNDVVKTLDLETVVLPGHGPATTIAAELSSNPYLA